MSRGSRRLVEQAGDHAKQATAAAAALDTVDEQKDQLDVDDREIVLKRIASICDARVDDADVQQPQDFNGKTQIDVQGVDGHSLTWPKKVFSANSKT